MVTAKICCKLC